jgi:hypothetical protein
VAAVCGFTTLGDRLAAGAAADDCVRLAISKEFGWTCYSPSQTTGVSRGSTINSFAMNSHEQP